MNNNPGGFDPKKQQGKTVTIFSTKRNAYDLPDTERAMDPYQSEIPHARPRGQGVVVSRGIFQTRKDYFREENYNYSARGNLGFEEERGVSNYHKQLFQDFMNNEFKSQIVQYRFDLNQHMNVLLRDCNEKAGQNLELFQALKECVNQDTHQIEELEHKIAEYHSNLSSLGGSFKSFGEESSKALSSQKMQKIEYQQQEIMRDFERLKEQVAENLHVALQIYENEKNEKNKKMMNEIKANMEEKITKVLDHLNGKVAVLENQIEISNHIDGPVLGKIKEEMDEKLNEHCQRMQGKIENVKWSVGTKADEVSLKNNITSFGLDKKIEQAKYELESITAEIAQAAEQIRQENKVLNDRTLECEKVYYNQVQQFKANSFIPYNDSNLIHPTPKRNTADLEKKISEIEKDFEEVKVEQRELGNNIIVQKVQLEKSRSSSPSVIAQSAQAEEAHLRKLEEMIDALTQNVDTLRKKAILQSEETKISDYNPFTQSRGIEKSPPGAKQGIRRLSIHSSNSSPGGQARVDDLRKSNANIENPNDKLEKRGSTHSSPGATKNYKDDETIRPTKVHMEDKNIKHENEKPSDQPSEVTVTVTGAEEEEEDDDEIEVEVQIDDDGYLLDENGNYYVDKNGDKIKLDEKQIERLRHHNLIEEDE